MLFLHFCISGFSQAQLVVANNSEISLYKNCAILSDIMLMIKGDEWYKKYIIENIISLDQPLGRRKVSFTISVDSCGNMKMYPRSCTIKEINEGLKEAIEYIENNHVTIYAYNSYFARLLQNNKCATKQDVINAICLKEYSCNEGLPFTNITNGWMLYVPGPINHTSYDNYIQDKKKKGRNKEIELEWIKAKIDYYLSLPIKSSLDYGITNEDFCPQ